MVKLLVENGADVNFIGEDSTPWTDNQRYTSALHEAASVGATEIIKILIEYGVDINYTDLYGWSALALAEEEKNLECVEILIKNGAKYE